MSLNIEADSVELGSSLDYLHEEDATRAQELAGKVDKFVSKHKIPDSRHFNEFRRPLKITIPEDSSPTATKVASTATGELSPKNTSFVPDNSPKGFSEISETAALFQELANYIPDDSSEGVQKIILDLEKAATGEGLPETLAPEHKETIQMVAQILLDANEGEHPIEKTIATNVEVLKKNEKAIKKLASKDSSISVAGQAVGTVLQVANGGVGSPKLVQNILQAVPTTSFQTACKAIGISAATSSALALATSISGVAGLGILALSAGVKAKEISGFRDELIAAISNNEFTAFLEANLDTTACLEPIPKGFGDRFRAALPGIGKAVTGSQKFIEASDKNQRFKEMTHPTTLHQAVNLLNEGTFDPQSLQNLARTMEKEIFVHMVSQSVISAMSALNAAGVALAAPTHGILPVITGLASAAYMVANGFGLDNGVGRADKLVANCLRKAAGTDKKVKDLIDNMTN